MPSSSMKTPAELSEALRPVGAALMAVAVASGLINLLMLTGPLFMLQVYDRVLTSRSGATLVGLCIFALVTFLFQGLFEALRSHMLIKIGRAFANRMSPRVLDVLAEARGQEGLQAIRDLDTVRGFASSGLGALFDLPWTPLYIALCFAFHPSLGIAVLCGALLLALLTWAGDRVSRQPIEDLTSLSTQRNRLTEEMRRNASLIDSLGMRRRMQDVWLGCAGQHLDSNDTASAVSARLGAATRLLRTVLQSGVLALGAWLVINREASGGVMLAATILTIRALSPLEQAMANWRGFVAARQAWARLNEALAETPRRKAPMLIDLPKRELSLAGVTIAVPGTERAVVANASFTLRAGSALGIVGPSGSGKSSLARALVGTWPAARGVIRLDGATFDQWDRDVIGSALGYLPQDVELLSGTIAQNIARFAPDVPADAVQRAAMEADVHDLILRLPGGYDMQVGEGGAMLSGGQRQRIGLARALFGQPFLVVLDEPNSNLDGAGEQALLRAILGVRKRGGIAVVIAHRPSALAAVDQLMVLNEGHVQAIGPRDEVLAALAGTIPAKPAAEPAKAATKPATKAAAPKTRRSRSTKGVVNGHAHALA